MHFPDKAIIIASYPRSGTHLTIDFLRKQFVECQANLAFMESRHNAYLTLEHLSSWHRPHINKTQACRRLAKAKMPIVKTHCLPDFSDLGVDNQDFLERLLEIATIFYVVRDGRKVLCSFHLGKQAKNMEARCSVSEYMRKKQGRESSFPKSWANHVSSWIQHPNVNIIRSEDLLTHPLETLERISDIIGYKPIYKQPLLPLKFAPRNRLEDYWLRFRRQCESTAIDSKFSYKRKPWRELLNQADCHFFHQKAGDILIKLGYEKDIS